MERRSFLKASAALGCAATVAGCDSSSDDASVTPPTPPISEEKQSWSACLSNCGSNCPLKVITRDGKIVRIEADDIGDDSYGNYQIRPCARGRSNSKRVYNPDRLLYPMKRVGKRGSGEFERISWEQATSEIGQKLKGIYDNYGPRSVYYNYQSGAYYDINGASSWVRMLGTMGGFLRFYGSYSGAQVERILPMVIGYNMPSNVPEMAHSDLLLFFGFNPLETRQSGSGQGYEIAQIIERNNPKTVVVDCRYTDTLAGKNMDYYPCRPGTDAALCSAIVYHLIENNLVDEKFVSTKCYGFRGEDPIPSKGLDALPYERSYEAYILGVGELDSQAKTPEWAERICGVPAHKIRELAEQLAAAKAPFIAAGYGIQRHANGENNAWAISALCMVLGAVGKRGTNIGVWPGSAKALYTPGLPFGNLEQTAKISMFTWPDAILDGENMTVLKDGVQLPADELDENGDGKLGSNIKAIINFAGNILINQHSDCFGTAKILEREELCELIVVSDCHMTASAKFADYLLPDSTWLESDDIANQSYSAGSMSVITPLTKAIEPLGECRSSFEVCADIAEVMGTKAAFTEGRTFQETLKYYYENLVAPQDPILPPTLEAFQEGGIVKKFAEPSISDCSLYDYVQNGGEVAGTVSGKLELFSHAVDAMNKKWEKPDYVVDHFITPVPAYIVTWEGYEDKSPEVTDKPLQLIGHHMKGRTHSSYHSVQWLREAVHDGIWINPADAVGFSDGDWVIVESLRGKVKVQARVTQRIMPGVVSLAQGAWFKPENGIDIGGCVNTLTAYRPSPIAKGNPQHTNRVKVYKA